MTTAQGRQTSEDAVTRVHYYRNVCGIPCGPHGDSDRITLHIRDIGALSMPASLGERTHDRMLLAGVSGPIFSHDIDRWTFLTGPHQLGGEMTLVARLNALNVQIVPIGAEVLLPSPADEVSRRRRWIAKPRDMFRPSIGTVLNALGHVTGARPVWFATEVASNV